MTKQVFVMVGGDRHEPSVLGVVHDNEAAANRVALAMTAESGSEVWAERAPLITLEDAKMVRTLLLRLTRDGGILQTDVRTVWSWCDPGPAQPDFVEGGTDPILVRGTDFAAMLEVLEDEMRNRAWKAAS